MWVCFFPDRKVYFIKIFLIHVYYFLILLSVLSKCFISEAVLCVFNISRRSRADTLWLFCDLAHFQHFWPWWRQLSFLQPLLDRLSPVELDKILQHLIHSWKLVTNDLILVERWTTLTWNLWCNIDLCYEECESYKLLHSVVLFTFLHDVIST